jgi:phage-related protein (TIGR01555 family)
VTKKQVRNSGQFVPGKSGNPAGRPPRESVRHDAVYNEYTGHGTTDDPTTFTRHYTRPVSETEAIDLRRGSWLARRILEDLPNDCFRKGYTLKLPDKETAEAVMTCAETLGVNAKLAEAGAMADTVGGAALFPVLDGALGDLSTPLDLDDAPRILSVRAIHLLESRELVPVTWYGDIAHPKFRQPELYRLSSLGSGTARISHALIHESRLAIFPGKRVSFEQQPGQPWGWGDSKLTPVRDVIFNFGLAWGSASAVLRNFAERIIKVKDLMKIKATRGGEAALENRLRYADRFRSTLRGQLFDSEDSIETLIDSIAGMPDLLVQFANVVCAAAEEPMKRLFGLSSEGFSSGEFDDSGWRERVESEQVRTYTSPVEWLLRLIMLSTDGPTGGDEPDVWSVEWKPLKHQSEKEVAETRKLVAETDEKYVDMGLPVERLFEDRFGGDTFSMETTFNAAEFRKQQAEREKMAAEIAAAQQQGAEDDPPPGEPDKPSTADDQDDDRTP